MDDFKKQMCIKRYGSPPVHVLKPVSRHVMFFFFFFAPISRVGEADEIGGVVAFLCTEEASYITGETIAATGGMGCRL